MICMHKAGEVWWPWSSPKMRQLCIGSRASSESAVGKSLPSNGLRSQILSVLSVQGRFNSVMSESRYAYMHLICIRESENADVFVREQRTTHMNILIILLLGQLAHFHRSTFWAKTSQIRSERLQHHRLEPFLTMGSLASSCTQALHSANRLGSCFSFAEVQWDWSFRERGF